MTEERCFEVGNVPPKVMVHFEFDFTDTQKYLGDVVIESEEEAERLEKKYNS